MALVLCLYEVRIMKVRNARLLNRILATAAIFLLLSAPLEADTATLYCEGVNYIYQAGIGNGRAKREAAKRTLILNLKDMKAKLANGDEVRTTQLAQKYGAYHGFFPGKTQVFGTAVLGEQLEIDTTALSLDLRYVLEDQRRFLSFTGICRH